MGTRHLIEVVKNGKTVVAQYGQWDGYPSGAGLGVLHFLRKLQEDGNGDAFRQHLDLCRFATDSEVRDMWTKAGAAPDSDFVSMEVSDRFATENPQLSRDASYHVLDMIMANESNGFPLPNRREFAGDGLFCEWAYVIDLDKMVLEGYAGFGTAPLGSGERYAELTKPDDDPDVIKARERGDTIYQPVRLIASWPLTDLPTDEDFVAKLEPNDDEGEDDDEGSDE